MLYKQKPVFIEAVQWTGDNADEVQAFIGDNGHVKFAHVDIESNGRLMVASIGYYIIKESIDEFYTCHKDTFEETYEPV